MADPAWRHLTLPPDLAGQRLDQALAAELPEFSRGRLQTWIKAGRVLVNGGPCRTRDRVWGGEQVQVEPDPEVPPGECEPQPVPLDILFEDQDLLIIHKPAGLVVHPAAGNWDGTLQNGLLYHDPNLGRIPRAGIVHRLDKDTSGLLMVARSLRAHTSLVAQLQARQIRRQYLALVNGIPVAGGRVDLPIGRHPQERTRMAVTPGGKPAVTHYSVLENFQVHSLLQVRLETGRTHQIRVHLAQIGYPICGDPVYGGRARLPPKAPPELAAALRSFKRQALHAELLGLRHPGTGEDLEWEVPPPEDMLDLIDRLREASEYE
jgi:23S rRNA pseudouridine1911/1915/1917 synthase